MKDGTIGVLVVEDDDDFCFLIGDTLGREPDMRILGSTASGEEAVYLAERVLILTNKPATIKEEVEIDLPRPRQVSDPKFIELRRHITEQIRWW